MKRNSTQAALWASLIYAVGGGAWIFFSDRFLSRHIQDLDHLTRLEISKGMCFVLFTAGLLFFVVRHLLAKDARQLDQLQKADALTLLQKETLELIAGGKPLSETLCHLLKGVEKHSPDMICTIMLLAPDGQRLRMIAAPSLPEAVAKASDGLPVGPKAGSCGTAAFRGAPVFVRDIADDPLWAECREVVLPHGLRACWSTPILDEQKRVLGTFGIYHRTTGLPTNDNVRVIEIVTHTAAIAIAKILTEQSLRENDERFRTLFDQASDAIFAHDREGRLLSVNQAACTSLGYSRSELLSLRVTDVESGMDADQLQQLWNELPSGRPQIKRGQHRRKDGSIFPVEVNLNSSRVQGETVLLAIARNITERAEYETRLATSEESYRNFFNTVTDAIYVLNQEGKFLAVNDGAVAMYGHPKEFFTGKTPECLSAPGRNDLAAARAAIEGAFAGEDQEFEWWGIRANGEIFPKEVKLKRGVYFGHPVVFATGRDITDRKRMEDELRAAGERTRFYMDRMPLAFIAWDRDFRVAEWNPAAEAIFGWSTDEAGQRFAYDFLVPLEAQPHVEQVWSEVIQTGSMASHSINENLTKSGRRITCEWRNTPWRDASGQICGCLSIVTDITERLQAEQERQNLEAQLRQAQKMEAIGQLSGGIAHDFNNILTVIQGNASLLQGLELNPGEIHDCASQITRAAERASRLTRQLLMFARKQQMQPASLDLNEVVAHITKMLRRILGEDITLRTEFAPALPLIHADVGMLEQIVLNLAVNARDAMAEGGTLTIRTSLAKDPDTGPDATENHISLEVTDNGCGIPPEIQPRIFEPFFTTKEVGKGTGLGLATVYGIVQQHHGNISVESKPGKTTFTILFPASSERESAEPNPDPKPVLPWGTETILVVEDELPLRTFVSDLLQRCGYTVLEAESGPAALKLWETRAKEIALVFTDIIMPENMNGLELGRRLLAGKPDLKVVYTSGYTGNVETRLHASLIEGGNFIQKPYKPDVLATVIRNALDHKTPAA